MITDLFSIVEEEACTTALKARSKQACLSELSNLVARSFTGINAETIRRGLEEREQKGSTAFGDEIAIPHTRIRDIDKFVLSIAVSQKGVDYEALDRKRTKIFFTIIGPGTEQETYLKVLAQVSRVAKNRHARKELLKAPTPLALKETFLRYLTPGEGQETAKAARNLDRMKLLFITLYEKKYLQDLIEVLVSNKIGGISILDSRGSRSVLSNVPLFSEFFNFTGERSEVSKTILSVVDQDLIPRIVEGIEAILGDLNKHAGVMIMALDIHYMKGTLDVL
jgi:PTS system nitrogen regulatory IIA component